VYCRDLWKLTTHILGAANDTAQVKRFFPQQAAPPVEKSAAL
jgi:hypothetical protein